MTKIGENNWKPGRFLNILFTKITTHMKLISFNMKIVKTYFQTVRKIDENSGENSQVVNAIEISTLKWVYVFITSKMNLLRNNFFEKMLHRIDQY